MQGYVRTCYPFSLSCFFTKFTFMNGLILINKTMKSNNLCFPKEKWFYQCHSFCYALYLWTKLNTYFPAHGCRFAGSLQMPFSIPHKVNELPFMYFTIIYTSILSRIRAIRHDASPGLDQQSHCVTLHLIYLSHIQPG